MSQRERAAWPDPPQLETRGSTQSTLGPVASWETQPARGHHARLKLTKESKEEEEERAKQRRRQLGELRSAHRLPRPVPKLQDDHRNM